MPRLLIGTASYLLGAYALVAKRPLRLPQECNSVTKIEGLPVIDVDVVLPT
jgi:hypothetical protein